MMGIVAENRYKKDEKVVRFDLNLLLWTTTHLMFGLHNVENNAIRLRRLSLHSSPSTTMTHFVPTNSLPPPNKCTSSTLPFFPPLATHCCLVLKLPLAPHPPFTTIHNLLCIPIPRFRYAYATIMPLIHASFGEGSPARGTYGGQQNVYSAMPCAFL